MNQIEWLSQVSVSDIFFIKTYAAKQNIYPINKTNRPYHAFIYTIKGIEEYNIDGKIIRATPNSLLYIPKGANYVTTLEGEESVVICIDFELCNKDCPNAFSISFPQSDSLYSYFADAEIRWEKTVGYKAFCKSLFYKIIGTVILQRNLYLDSKALSKLAESIKYMQENYLNIDFRIEELYRIAGVSAKYYGVLFYKKYGMTPKEYVLFLRIERAKKLLGEDKCLISDVAGEIGYRDYFYFSKVFKNKTGYSPSEYRKLLNCGVVQK